VARNRIHIDAAPSDVFSVLADPFRYPQWVVGARRVRDSDSSFPAVGARFHHSVAIGPFSLNDHTEVLAVEPPSRILLKAKARPLGTALVELELTAAKGGTAVTMEEKPGDRLSSLLTGNPPAQQLLRLRNAEALSRLKRLLEAPPSPPSRAPGNAGRRVLVTGGSSGIGLASAKALAREGARVVLLARGEQGLVAAEQRLREQGADVRTVSADVADRAGLEAAVEEAAAKLGGLDLVVCAAAGSAFGRFTEIEPDDFDATVATVLGGAVNTIRVALPHLERSGGALVVVGSIAAHMPLPTLSAYTAAKHALAGFLDCLRIELAEAGSSVAVSMVNPGAVDTPLWDNLQSANGLLPPVPPGLYVPEAVADAVLAVAGRPRAETTVGGLAASEVFLWSSLRRPTERALAAMTRLALSAGDRPAGPGALHAPSGRGETSGGFGGRRSLVATAISAWNAARRAVGAG
jgi:NAD(P)-dependent dehydrogenase (short-subunit alcohol dehydrogenase family)/uncharacterized protein YndB with AHSA1/START domain